MLGSSDGVTVGGAVGVWEGKRDGRSVGVNDGSAVGEAVGEPDGETDGCSVGVSELD